MIVIPDSSVLCLDYWSRGTQLPIMFQAAHHGYSFRVPQVVVDETKNKFREQLREADKHNKRIFPPDIYNKAFLASIEDKFDTGLEILVALTGQTIDYPTVEHERVVRRALARMPPFKPDGKDGYRDTLIWESVLSELRTGGSVIFVTENSKDFGKGDRLKPILQAEVDAILQENSTRVFRYFSSIVSFNQAIVTPVLETVKEVWNLLASGNYDPLDLAKWLKTFLADRIPHQTFRVHQHDSYENGLLGSVHEVPAFEVVDVKRLDDDRLAIYFRAKIDGEFEFFVYRHDQAVLRRDLGLEITPEELSGVDSFVYATKSSVIEVSGNLILEPSSREVKNISVSQIEDGNHTPAG